MLDLIISVEFDREKKVSLAFEQKFEFSRKNGLIISKNIAPIINEIINNKISFFLLIKKYFKLEIERTSHGLCDIGY